MYDVAVPAQVGFLHGLVFLLLVAAYCDVIVFSHIPVKFTKTSVKSTAIPVKLTESPVKLTASK